jgi:ferric-dicitrate binding protein FerR (iron transport regulator)
LTLVNLAAVCRLSAIAEDTVGRLDQVSGMVTISRAIHQFAAAAATPLQAGDRLTTGPGATASIQLTIGDRLTLSESSAIVLDEQPSPDEHGRLLMQLATGRVRATVATTSAATSRAFELRTPNARAVAHGTEFAVTYIAGKACPDAPGCRRYTDVSVYKGIVEVTNPADPNIQPVHVHQGYASEVPCELSPTSPAPIGMNELGAPSYQ